MSEIPGVLREIRAALRTTLTATPRASLTLPVTFTSSGVTGTIWSSADIYAGDELEITGAGTAANRGTFLVLAATASQLTLQRTPGTAAPLVAEGPVTVSLRVPAPSRRYWEGGPVVDADKDWPSLRDELVVQSADRRSIEGGVIHLRLTGTWMLDLTYRGGDGTAAMDAWAAEFMLRYAPGGRVVSPAGQIVRIRTLTVGATQPKGDRAMRPVTLTWYADARSPS